METAARAGGTGSANRISTPAANISCASSPMRVTVVVQRVVLTVRCSLRVGRGDEVGTGAVDEEAGEVREDHRYRRSDQAGEEHCGYTHRDRLRLRLPEGQADGDEVTADLAVDGEQRGKCVLHGQVARRDLGAHEHADDLCDRGTGTEDRGQDRDRG